MKQKDQKPAFLKTFSEFTIEELRVMPITELFSLFIEEVGTTFTERKAATKSQSSKSTKKQTKKPLLVAKIKHPSHFSLKLPVVHPPHLSINTTGFSEAMKRVFTPGPVKMENVGKKNGKHSSGKNGVSKKDEEETVVFSKNPVN